jgi:predicted phosphodiesterase
MYKYTHFIPENIAPVGTEKIGVYNGVGEKVCDIPLGNLAPPNATKLYSFCALADIHLTYDTANADFQRALTFAESNCDFTCIAGDLTENAAIESQLATYKSIVDQYAPTKPVYAITGNHENYDGYSDKYLENYTGHPLYYSFTKGNDVFIMVGHFGAYRESNWLSTEFVSTEELQWLYETLEANRNKRCFIFNHVLPIAHGVGDPCGLYGKNSGASKLWDVNDGGIGQAYISLLKHYKNTILFHGHSHTRFWLQELDEKANYSNENGYRSVHIPSLAVPRDLSEDETKLETIYAESEGYIVDVYDDCIVLNGRDFIDNDADGHILPIATYKIDTTLHPIEANTFTDSTGTIVT